MHLAVAVSLIVFPVSLIVVLTGVDHLARAPLHATLPLSLVERAVLVSELSVAMAHAVLPVALVNDTFLLVDVLAFTVAQSVQDVALVGALIRPRVSALASDFVLSELTTVDSAVGPFKHASAAKQAQLELTLVLVAIFELTGSVTVVHLADLY